MPRICVIVPVYKVESYLYRCIESILNQTFTNFELILVDDGSPDNCPKICEEYAAADSRVRVIHQKNGGLSAARNAGIDWAFANSDSQWLTFIDSDDWVHPEMLERLLKAAEEKHVAVSICEYVETAGETTPNVKIGETRLWKPEDYYIGSIVNATTAWGKLYKKSCFETLRYPVGKIHEDEYITYQILFAREQIVVLEIPMYYYYQNPDGITKSGWTRKRLDAAEARKEQIAFFNQKGFLRARDRSGMALFWNYVSYIDQLAQQADLREHKYVVTELRKAIIRYQKLLNISVGNTPGIYERAYPRMMKIYWIWKALLQKIRKEK